MADATIARPSKAAKPFMGSREEARLAKAVRYIDGIPCNRNHQPTIRLTSNRGCVDCRDMRQAEGKQVAAVRQSGHFLEGVLINGKPVFEGLRSDARKAGAFYYVNPRRPCLKCSGFSARFVSNTLCAMCVARWQEENAEAVKLQRKGYREKNRDRLCSALRDRYAANPEPYRAAAKKNALENPERRQASAAKYRLENAVSLKLYYNEWRLANPEKAAAKAHKRRARKLGSTEHFTGDDARLICDAQGNACAYCWITLTSATKANDHFIPLAGKGITGSNGPDNIIVACRSCNARKSNRQPDVFIEADHVRLSDLRLKHGEPDRSLPLLPILQIIDDIFLQLTQGTLQWNL